MKLTTCLWFDGNAREAAEYYVNLFPNSQIGNNWIAPTDTPSNQEGSEVVVDFVIFDQNFIGLNGGPMFKFNESISFQIPCANQQEIDHYWDTIISDGGEAGRCGWLKDKFGVSWQVTCRDMEQYIGGPDPAGAEAATKAMMSMTKIVLSELKHAYESSANN